jgi:hypothetical protein
LDSKLEYRRCFTVAHRPWYLQIPTATSCISMDRVTVCRISVLLVQLVYEMRTGVHKGWSCLGQHRSTSHGRQQVGYKPVSTVALCDCGQLIARTETGK